jgi:hypothetical protein
VETFEDNCLRPSVESIAVAFREALARFNSS